MRIFLTLFFFCSLSLSARTVEEIIQQARDFVGSEEALEAVEAIRFSGVLDPADEAAEELGLNLLIEKPGKQRLVVEAPEMRTTSVVNRLQGFVIRENLETGMETGSPLGTEQIRNLQANSIENLYFFRFPTRFQVRVKYLGEEEIAGREVDAVRYVHRGGIVYVRYFDSETGALVATRADNGLLNVEKGRRIVDGLKFAEKVESYADGELVHTIRFEDIAVNPEIPEDAFEIR